MRVGINLLFLIPGEVGGTENYSRSFLRELEKKDGENEYIVFCNIENNKTFSFHSPKWKKIVCPVHGRSRISRLLYEQSLLLFQIQKNRCDVVHSFGYIGPILASCKKIVTIHDANWKDHPEDVSPLSGIVQNVLTQLTMYTAQVIITDSVFSESRLKHYYPVWGSKVRVVSPWVSQDFLSSLKKAKREKSLFQNRPYILCVSGFYPHKKVSYLLDVFDQIKRFSSINLLVVGKNGRGEEQLILRIKNTKGVIYKPQVSLEELTNLYVHAQLFAFPSVYEGFGYPVYEAINAGIPVFVSNKELYNQEVKEKLSELTGDVQKDARLLLRSLEKQNSQLIYNSSEQSIKKLVSIYKKQ